MQKRLQVFVSSTFTDMQAERQAAVEAILEAGHIPAGMELFSAGDESQLETIKHWIERSDVHLLLLGGRYGTLEPKSGKSYVELEYEYAAELGKPLFAIVIKEEALEVKVKANGSTVLEQEKPELLKAFRQRVLGKTSRFFEDTKDVKIAILQKLTEFVHRDDLPGWVRGDEAVGNEKLAAQLADLLEENRNLHAQVDAKKSSPSSLPLPEKLADDDIVAVLRSALREMPAEKRFSVIFFEHIDEVFRFPQGTAKRLLERAADGALRHRHEHSEDDHFQKSEPDLGRKGHGCGHLVSDRLLGPSGCRKLIFKIAGGNSTVS